MKFLIDQLHFLGMNEREVRVFTALATFGQMNMTKLASRAALPRTTVDAIVRRFVEKDLISQVRVKKHYEYRVDLRQVADRLTWIEKRLREPDTAHSREKASLTNMQDAVEGDTFRSTINDESIVNYEKTPDKIIESIFAKKIGDRIRALVARGSTVEDTLQRIIEYTTHACVYKAKLELLVCVHVAEALREREEQFPMLSVPDSIILHIVPSAYCTARADTLVFPEIALVRGVYTKDVLGVEEPRVVEAMQHLLTMACETGWSAHLSSWLERV